MILMTPLPKLLDRSHRGMLLDIVMFIANLFVMRTLTGYFLDVYRRMSDTDRGSQVALMLCCIGMLLLPPAGAVLKRWHYHARRASGAPAKGALWGCLCNPIFYFCLNLVVMAAIMTLGGHLLLGREYDENGGIFVTSILLGMVITGVQTFLVYRYFTPPKSPPRWSFLRDRRSEVLGDICIYLNMALFQAAWNLMTFAELEQPSGLTEFAGRLFFLSFIALLIYFPPRIFYLAEDINRRSAWLTMFLASTPVIARVLFGL